jgi:hypothetical protein
MAFPVIESVASTGTTSNQTSRSINMPSGIVAGDLLLAVVASDGNTTFGHTGWDKTSEQTCVSGGNTQARGFILTRTATGSNTLTLTTAASEMVAAVVYRISGWSAFEVAGLGSTATSTAPNPPSLNPAGWDVEDTLWIAACAHDQGQRTVSGYPANYTLNQTNARGSNTGGCGVGAAGRQNAVASEDPAAFTISTAEEWAAWTIAVRPAATPPQEVSPTGVASTAALGAPTVSTPGPPSLAGWNSGGNGTSYDISYAVPMPSSIAADDLLIVATVTTGSSDSVRPETPSGWTELGFRLWNPSFPRTLCVFVKKAAGSEGATVTFSLPSGNFQGWVTTSARVAAANWSQNLADLEISAFGDHGTASGTSLDAPAISSSIPAENRGSVRILGGRDKDTITAPSGITQRAEHVQAATHSAFVRLYEDDTASVAARNFTISSSPSGPLMAVTVAVKGPGGGSQTVSPSGLASTAALGAPTITATRTVSPSGVGSTAALGAPTITATRTVSPSGVASTAALGAPTLAPGPVTLSPAGLASTSALGAPTLVPGPRTVSPSGVASTAALGAPTLSAAATVSPSGVASTAALGAPLVSGAGAVYPSGVASTAALGAPTLVPGAVTVSPAGVASTSALGAPTLTATRTVSPAGVASTAALGAPTLVPGAATVSPTGVASTVQFGDVTAGSFLVVAPSGVASAAQLGSPTVSAGAVTVSPTGVAGSAAVGAAQALPGPVSTNPTGIASTALLGAPSLVQALLVSPSGVEAGAAFGAPTVSVPGFVAPASLPVDAEPRIGKPVIYRVQARTGLGTAVSRLGTRRSMRRR